MCTIVALSRVREDFGLVIAANRDEFYARQWDPPQVLSANPRIVGGRDRARGGTWLGLTSRGFFVGLTNQRTMVAPDPSLRSRGAVVLEALSLGDCARVTAYLTALDAPAYPSFNLLYGDASALFVAYARADGVRIEALPPGVWVLTNDVLGSPEFPKATRAETLVRGALTHPWPALSRALESMLADRDSRAGDELDLAERDALPLDPALLRALQCVCVRTPVYGTVSATVAALGHGHVAHYAFASGPPDTHRFEDLRSLLRVDAEA